MTIVVGIALILLGLAIGFLIAWAFGVGASTGLFIGFLLVVAGAIVGFISEWLIDEAYRKNRELRRQLLERGSAALALSAGSGDTYHASASETLADFLRRRDDEISALRDQLSAADAQLDAVREEAEAYQRTHPDDLTVIKGIGPVYQWKLRDAGFNAHEQLARADPGQLRRMLDIKNWQQVSTESWIEQARDYTLLKKVSPPRVQEVKAYAVAQIQGYEQGVPLQAYEEYLLQAGVLASAPRAFKAKPIALPSQETVQIDITVHAEGMDTEPGFMQTFTYRQGQQSDLLEFRLTPREIGHKQIRVEFYYEQHWLAQIKFEVEVIAAQEPVSA
jgi:predicted flap endonuclease-1-like 5' DNA nuclease